MTQIQDILHLSEKLIQLDTRPENFQNLETALEIIQEELSEFKIRKYSKNGYKSILVHNQKKIPEKFRLLFNCHLDIIPAKDEQFKPYIKNGRLYGAGAMDMKSNLACVLSVFKKVAQHTNYPLGIQFVTDEEIGGYNGTKYQVQSGVKSEFIIASEPTNLDVVYQAKGVLQCEISCFGTTAHSAYPWNGNNALENLLDFLKVFRKSFSNPSSELWETSYNIASITCENTSYNKIPDSCSVMIDIRYISSEADTIKKKLEKIIPNNFKVDIYAFEPPLNTNKNHPDIGKILDTSKEVTGKAHTLYSANGTSDARHFGKDGIEFGPVGGGIGTDEEWVEIASLEKYSKILEKFILSINK
ncbi:M20 family metallopeptidase [Candidatus Gracilibacteria bacterium]|nr:M20 family metallopeptidase [Candidatus Gracilibacteria bacterium]